MTVQAEITRITESRNTMRNKLVDLGLVQSTAKIDDIADAVYAIENNGAINAEVTEGASYTIPKGYHNGSGVVKGVAGGGNYSLQQKTVTPTKAQQSVVSDSGFYGLSSVTINAIPEVYQDISITTATAPDVLANKVFVDSKGATTTGTMPNNGAISKELSSSQRTYTVPKGYHSGSGSVSIPDTYYDIQGTTAVSSNVLSGSKFVNSDGELTTGTMPNKGAISGTIDGLTTTSYKIPVGYHNGSGTVSLTTDIEESLSDI